MNQQKNIIFKKNIKNLFSGIIHVQSTFNNTIITITDVLGNTISSASAGSLGFKGTRKASSFAAQLACEKAVTIAKNSGLKKVEIWLKGPAVSREITIKTIKNLGLDILIVRDITKIPHNGCRPSKKRRI